MRCQIRRLREEVRYLVSVQPGFEPELPAPGLVEDRCGWALPDVCCRTAALIMELYNEVLL